jgi:hypothetical protein
MASDSLGRLALENVKVGVWNRERLNAAEQRHLV